jgi:1-acyl-sn-glycerol-3-phosphate acyltransferase
MDILKSITIWLVGILFLTIFFPITLITWLMVLPIDRNRIVTHWMLMYQSVIISHLLPIWRITIEGRKKMVPGTTYVIISNHQSILDILLINCLCYRFKWVSKKEVNKVPVLGWYLKMADYLTVDRGDKESKEKMMIDASKCLEKKISVMMFPEGTRSTDGNVKFFKRGAFQLAIAAGVPILPVLLDGSGDVLPKHGRLFHGYPRIRIKVLDPVTHDKFITNDCDTLAKHFQEFMTSELDKLRKEPEK